MAKKEFEFVEMYRMMVPSAGREIIDARHKGHQKLHALIEDMDKVYDLCRLAFQIQVDTSALRDWFEKNIKKLDPQFSLEIDKAEAGRIATLLLRHLISEDNPKIALAVLVTSFCGRRVPINGGDLLKASLEAIAETGGGKRLALREIEIALPVAKDLSSELELIQNSPTGPNVRGGMEALSADLRQGVAQLAKLANEAFHSLLKDTTRLAEEVDMLWWHIGDWSELLNKPRGELTAETAAVASGIELGSLVRGVPGPYGAYGVLRRSLGKLADNKVRLKDVVERIKPPDLALINQKLPNTPADIFHVHAAIRSAAENAPGKSGTAPADVSTLEVTNYELSIQTFHEQILGNASEQ